MAEDAHRTANRLAQRTSPKTNETLFIGSILLELKVRHEEADTPRDQGVPTSTSKEKQLSNLPTTLKIDGEKNVSSKKLQNKSPKLWQGVYRRKLRRQGIFSKKL
jgi:hypothetical protein